MHINYYRFNEDIDKDGDGLIEIYDLEGLNVIRHQADGTGYRKTSTDPKITIGCPANGCIGYELTDNLDLSAADDWLPINAFTGIFEGNGHTISNLTINRPNTDGVGLFGDVERGSEINNIGLLNVDIKGSTFVGGLVGQNNSGSIKNSYAIGSIDGRNDVGGLVGQNNSGSIKNSYVIGSIHGVVYVGGLVGQNDDGSITNSYTIGYVDGQLDIGGLVGWNRGSITNSYAIDSVIGRTQTGGLVGLNLMGQNNDGVITDSYWDTDTSDISISGDDTGKTTAELQSPTAATGIYSSWSTDNWDFGTSRQLPMLKYAEACSATKEEGISQPVCGTLLPNQDAVLPIQGAVLGASEVSPNTAIHIQIKVFPEGLLQ